jgi:hypothetical protein
VHKRPVEIGDPKDLPIGLARLVPRCEQVANERVDLAALSFPFDCEQSHFRTAVGAGNRKILNIRSKVVFLAHVSDNCLYARHERARAWPGVLYFKGGRATGTFRGNVGRPFRGSQVRRLPDCDRFPVF